MRPVICKCPNYTGCLLGYHCDDIEITEDMALVCPECGTPLKPATRRKSDLPYHIANFIGMVALAGAIWYSWPSIVRAWQKATTPAPRTYPPKPPVEERTGVPSETPVRL